jgi:hypothetical protein
LAGLLFSSRYHVAAPEVELEPPRQGGFSFDLPATAIVLPVGCGLNDGISGIGFWTTPREKSDVSDCPDLAPALEDADVS